MRIGFEWGVALPDPAGLLEGGGKQVRYVTIRKTQDLQRQALAELLIVAAAIPPQAHR